MGPSSVLDVLQIFTVVHLQLFTLETSEIILAHVEKHLHRFGEVAMTNCTGSKAWVACHYERRLKRPHSRVLSPKSGTVFAILCCV